jgi:hypothetical protein
MACWSIFGPVETLDNRVRRHDTGACRQADWVGYAVGYRRAFQVNLTLKVNHLREICDSDPKNRICFLGIWRRRTMGVNASCAFC